MSPTSRAARFCAFSSLVLSLPGLALAQANIGSITGEVVDSTGAVIPNATVTIQNPVSGYRAKAITDSTGHYQFSNLPFNTYHVVVAASGFGSVTVDADVRSFVPLTLNEALKTGQSTENVTVQGNDIVESGTTFHTDVDRDLFNKVPLESESSSLSSLVTLTTPGVAADSNGLFHGLGDHASNLGIL